MKERPIFPLLVSMALPMVLSMTVNALYNIVDSFFVAQISEQAMTALSLVYPVQNMINAIAIGFGVGINALIALYSGAGDRCRADTAATHGLVFSILHGLIAAVVCIAMMPGFLRLFTGDEAVIALGVRYSSIAFFFSPVIMAELCFEKLFQAVGRMNETMAALLCGSITNIILDPVLIFGLGPFPMLGISGAALATGIGQCVTLSVYLIIYCTHRFPVRLRLSCIKPDWRLDARLYSIGVPAILNLAHRLQLPDGRRIQVHHRAVCRQGNVSVHPSQSRLFHRDRNHHLLLQQIRHRLAQCQDETVEEP